MLLCWPAEGNYKNKNQGVPVMAWKKIWTYLELIRAIESYLEPLAAI